MKYSNNSPELRHNRATKQYGRSHDLWLYVRNDRLTGELMFLNFQSFKRFIRMRQMVRSVTFARIHICKAAEKRTCRLQYVFRIENVQVGAVASFQWIFENFSLHRSALVSKNTFRACSILPLVRANLFTVIRGNGKFERVVFLKLVENSSTSVFFVTIKQLAPFFLSSRKKCHNLRDTDSQIKFY